MDIGAQKMRGEGNALRSEAQKRSKSEIDG